MFASIKQKIDQTIDTADKRFEDVLNPQAPTEHATLDEEPSGYVASLENVRDVLQKDLERAEKKVSTLNAMLDASAKSKKGLQERFTAKEEEVQAAQALADTAERDRAAISERLEAALQLIGDMQDARAVMVSELDSRAVELTEARERHTAEVDELTEIITRAQDEKVDDTRVTEEDMERVTEERDALKGAVGDLEGRMAALKEEFGAYRNTAAQALEDEQSRAAPPSPPLQDSGEVDQLKGELDIARGQLTEATDRTRAAEDDLERTRAALKATKEKLGAAEGRVRVMGQEALVLRGRVTTGERDLRIATGRLEEQYRTLQVLQAAAPPAPTPPPVDTRVEQLRARLHERQVTIDTLRGRVAGLEAREETPYGSLGAGPTVVPVGAVGPVKTVDDAALAGLAALNAMPIVRLGVVCYVGMVHLFLLMIIVLSFRGGGDEV